MISIIDSNTNKVIKLNTTDDYNAPQKNIKKLLDEIFADTKRKKHQSGGSIKKQIGKQLSKDNTKITETSSDGIYICD